jgi:NAD(P) transhydrogenase
VDSAGALACDVVIKVRPPSLSEARSLKSSSRFIGMLRPAANKPIVDVLAQRGVTSFAMDQVPRISRAQVFDALSSMANVAGYRAIVEAAGSFGRFFAGQSTAAGRIPPAKVFVIGGGVAGLSAIATARSMGAVVRGFDVRAACKEQVESLGAQFLEVAVKESGDGAGGYAREMSAEFNAAAAALFAKQCAECDIIVTTALIPGRPAPKLITAAMVAAMRQGSVLVDLAAEGGGNCEATVAGQKVVTPGGVTVIGYTDLPSRLPGQASALYANNVAKLLLSMGDKEGRLVTDLSDDVVRMSMATHGGAVTFPPAPIAATSALVTASPATSRSSTRSKPLRLGLRAQPGRPTHSHWMTLNCTLPLAIIATA